MIEDFEISRPKQLTELLSFDFHTILNDLKEITVDVSSGTGIGFLTGGFVGAGVGAASGIIATRGNFKALRDHLRKNPDPATQGWILCHNAMVTAVSVILFELNSKFSGSVNDIPTELPTQLESALQNSGVRVNREFFKDPAPEFVRRIQERLNNALEKTGLQVEIRVQVTSQLPSAFASALRAETQEHPEAYKELLEQIETPFDSAFQRKLQWFEYQDWLEARRHQMLFDEAFTLEDVYVPLRCYYLRPTEKFHKSKKVKRHSPDLEQAMTSLADRSVHLLDNYLDNWLEELIANYPTHDDVERVKQALRIVTGGPGSGKSTTVRRFAARLRERAVPMSIPFTSLFINSNSLIS